MRTRVMLISSAFLLVVAGAAVTSDRSEAAPLAAALAPLQLMDLASSSEVQKTHWRRYRHCHRRVVRRCWGWRHRCRVVIRRYCHRY